MILTVKVFRIRTMHSFCIRYAIALVLILTRNCAFAHCVEDVTCEHTIPAKVFTSFLKVPWINLNSSWTDQVAPHCKNDVIMLFDSADAGKMWALQMLDSTSRLPSGILMGNTRDLGQYDECIEAKIHDNPENFQGQHCMVSLSIPSKFVKDASELLYIQKLSIYNPTADVDLSLTLSVCLPSSCSIQDVVGFVNASIQSTPEFSEFEVSVAKVMCSGIQSADDLTMGTILTISFFVVIAFFLLSCTACDFIVRVRSDNRSLALKTLAKFSVYTTTTKLLSTEITPGTMPAIHGTRFLSTCLVLILHRSLFTMLNPLVNLSKFNQFRQSVLATLVLVLPYAVDTFLMISSFLVACSFLKQLRSGVKINVLQFYFHRYIRLTPCVGVLILFMLFIVPYYGSGPMWKTVTGGAIDNCRQNWWTNLLFIQNFVSREEMCLPHTWYSAVEMQSFLLSPIILYSLFHRPKLGVTMLGVLSIASMIIPTVLVLVNRYSFLFNTTKPLTEGFVDFFKLYTMTYNRALPYLVGILLGYDVVNKRRRITKMQAAFNWVLVCVLILFCTWNVSFIQPKAMVYDAVSEAIYVSFGRLAWTLAMAWMLYACTQGYGGPVTRFLSLPIFIPLSRMSYSIYLVHFFIQVGFNASRRTAEFFSPLTESYLVWGDLVMSIAVAFIMNVCIETPLIILEEIVRGQQPTTSINRAPTIKQKIFAAVMEKYFHLTNGQLGSDSALEMRTQQINFWRSISSVLNSSSERPTKTPGEWEKTWQEWKSDTQRASRAKYIQTEADQSQIKMPTLEQKFLTFLVAASYGFNRPANFEESGNEEPARFRQLYSRNLLNEDLVRSPISDLTPITKSRVHRRKC